ncbi:hypothetical protein GCM10028791_25880 [Echinicola sediminis]
MKKLIKNIPLLALIFAMVGAFAFNMPEREFSSEFGTPDSGQTWYDVTNVSMGPGPDQYQCNSATETCLYSEKDLNHPITSEEGEFVPGSSLIPE